MTLIVYTQAIPESVMRPVGALDSDLLTILGEFEQESARAVQ